MTEVPFDATWISQFAGAAHLDPLDADQIESLLALAGRAAHLSGDRRNAPLSCFLAGLRLGRDGAVPTVEALDEL